MKHDTYYGREKVYAVRTIVHRSLAFEYFQDGGDHSRQGGVLVDDLDPESACRPSDDCSGVPLTFGNDG